MKKLSKPEWILMFEKFRGREFENVLTYKELDECLLSGSVKTDKKYVFYKFKREMLRNAQKALENVRNIGYRIVKPNEHLRLSNREVRRAQKRLKDGVELILNVQYDLLTEKEQTQINLSGTRYQNLLATLNAEGKALKEITYKFRLPTVPRN